MTLAVCCWCHSERNACDGSAYLVAVPRRFFSVHLQAIADFAPSLGSVSLPCRPLNAPTTVLAQSRAFVLGRDRSRSPPLYALLSPSVGRCDAGPQVRTGFLPPVSVTIFCHAFLQSAGYNRMSVTLSSQSGVMEVDRVS